MIKIGHAVCDENGGSNGAAGNQSGRELRIQNWYLRDGGWDCYLEPIDSDLGKRAADIMERIIMCPSFGYSKKNRWNGYKNIVKAGGDITSAKPGDFDCSSLCISCYVLAGANIKATGYTGNMERLLLASGLFRSYSDSEHTDSCVHARVGGMYLSKGHHVCMSMEDAEPHEDKQYVHTKGSVKVRTEPVTGHLLMIARNQYLPVVYRDEITGWYCVETIKGQGFITDNVKYIEVVER